MSRSGGRPGPGFAILALLLSTAAVVLAPLVMGPAYRATSPALGPMTLWVVEILFALLIDFPLTGLFVALLTVLVGSPRNPARAALGFVGIFFAEIILVIALAPVHPLFAWLGLADTFGPAAVASLNSLGWGGQALFSLLFLAFDCLLCAAGGVAAAALVRGGAACRSVQA